MVYIVYALRENVQDVGKLSEEFRGNVPDIEIETKSDLYFNYKCVKTKHSLRRPCCYSIAYDNIDFKGCLGCLGLNRDFARYYEKYAICNGANCGMNVDFGYFIFIFLLEKAELLPKKFKMRCCSCELDYVEVREEGVILIEDLITEMEELSDGEEREG